MKIKKICIIALIIVLISSLATSCFAVTEATEATNNSKITKEQLNEKFQELKDNDSEIEKIVTGDNVIEVIKNNDKYEIEYEIEEDKVTFSIEAEVKQGMSWEEYTKLFGDSTGDASDGNIEDGLAMGYYAVANILGAEYKSAAWYYTLTRIEGYKGKYAKSDKWIIMKDAEGVTEIKTDSSEEKVLNTKDFANRTMEYFNSIYKDDTYTYEDSNHCNTYKSITEKKEKTDTSCKLIEKIIINTNADFSKLKVDMDSVLDNGVTEENADYVECDFIWEFPNKIRVDKQYPYKNKKEMLSFVRVVAWNKLIKRQLITDNNLEFPKGLRYEDVEFTYKLIPFINKFAYVDKPFIHYVQRKGSIANVQNERTAEIFTVLDNVIEFYKKNNIYEKYRDELEYNYARYLLCSSLKRMCKIKDKTIREKLLTESWKRLNSNFPNWKENVILKTVNIGKNKYMRTVNKSTYKIYSKILEII